LSGVLYLENRTASGIFNAVRVELLTLLSSQAAIAIDIARLIESARNANDEVRRTNERLELEVIHRTEELRHANDNLSTANQKLEQELLQRLEVEEQRSALNEQMLAGQKERLAELSTPLLPISKDIVVIPLIGSMDSERADQVLAVALDGAQRLGARVVLLDVTGLKHMDTHTAGMLSNVASALRLLGAETVITGIRPKIAQTLIALDINLQAFVTMATLHSGMDYALKRARGERIASKTRR
jgi:anti-anti-sigma factor